MGSMLATLERIVAPAVHPETGQPESVRDWPWVSLNIRPEHLDEWTRLADALDCSRAALLRFVLAEQGLPYARALLRCAKEAQTPVAEVG